MAYIALILKPVKDNRNKGKSVLHINLLYVNLDVKILSKSVFILKK